MRNIFQNWESMYKYQKVVCFQPNFSVSGVHPDAKVIDLSCKDSLGIDACNDPGIFMEANKGKPTLKRGHVYYHQVQE